MYSNMYMCVCTQGEGVTFTARGENCTVVISVPVNKSTPPEKKTLRKSSCRSTEPGEG